MDITKGILLIHKQAGRTSHDEVAIIKRALRDAGSDLKVGHSGTLDPKVTGLLVVGIGSGTRTLEYMLHSEKRYIGEIVFHSTVTRAQIESAIKHFTGKIEQLPPRKSSVKRALRTREVYEMEIQSFNPETKTVVIICAVERGTYIRKLFHDMGEHLGIRAHMGNLHRTHVGPFQESDGLITSEEFARLLQGQRSWNPIKRSLSNKRLVEIVLPPKQAMQEFGLVTLHPGVQKYISSGSDVFIPGIESLSENVEQGDVVGVYSNDGSLVAIGQAAIAGPEMMKQKKGVAIITKKVLI